MKILAVLAATLLAVVLRAFSGGDGGDGAPHRTRLAERGA